MPISSKLTIGIVGAGIAGLTLAAALRRFDIEAVIYEQAPRFSRVGAAIQLTPNAVQVLRGLGIEKYLRARSFLPDVGYNRDWQTGEITFLHPMGKQTEERYGAPDLSMHRAELQDALLSLVPAQTIRFGRRLMGLDWVADGVRLAFADGENDVVDALVGADGIHSIVRASVVGEEPLRVTGQVAYRAVYRTENLTREIDDRVKWWGPDRHIVTYKIDPRRDELYFIASTPEPDFKTESWAAPGDLSVLLAAYDGFHPDARLILESAPFVHKWAMIEREPLEGWTAERTILIGDAAHPMLPYMAQGAGAAMEDAVVLARCLQSSDRESINEAFHTCDRIRRPRTTKIQLDARRNVWMKTAADTNADRIYDYNAWSVPLRQQAEP
ncbi:MAG: FAD-dependent monooxygenase [Pseudomonadota bacterium]|nr:FAD-dependent monooxygenase [Pseudomonadota bacterium]